MLVCVLKTYIDWAYLYTLSIQCKLYIELADPPGFASEIEFEKSFVWNNV